MLDRLTGACMSFLMAAVAVYLAVRLIESVAAALVIIAAVIGGLVILGGVIVLVRRWYWSNRW
jgi:hypothetical protein